MAPEQDSTGQENTEQARATGLEVDDDGNLQEVDDAAE